MEKLRWLEIENYRGIRAARLENFGDINVIVGKNNTGKSTILESIYLNITAQDLDLIGNDPIFLIFKRRGVSLHVPLPYRKSLEIDDIFHYLGYIFYQENIDEQVKFNSNLLEYGLKVIKDNIPGDMLEFVTHYLTKRRFPKVEIGELLFIVSDNIQRPLMVAFEVILGEEVKYDIRFITHRLYLDGFTLRRQKRKNAIMVDSHWLFHYHRWEEPPIKTALMRLERYVKIDKQELIEFLSEQLGDNILTVEPRLFDIYVVTEDDRFIPFSLLGDGTKISLVYFYTLSLKNSYILFEEPENHLHPKLMGRCIDLMLKSAKINQIFITTHSLEFLQKTLERAKDADVNLRVFSITNLKNGLLEYESYDLDEAYAAVNRIGVDLR